MRLGAWTSLSLDLCCSDTLRKRRVQLKKSAAEQRVDSTVAIQKPPAALVGGRVGVRVRVRVKGER